jgi:hydroxymethylbilane synthase
LNLPKGLFTKELEAALLSREADLAVHSLKDLPTDLPPGLKLGAVGKRADVRDVLICRGAEFSGTSSGFTSVRQLTLKGLPHGATIATSSTRRSAQLLERRPDLKVVSIRGNVPTRLRKLAEQPEIDGLILAAAGLQRLQFEIRSEWQLVDGSPEAGITTHPARVPSGLLATRLEPEEMLPCVGQAAIGIEVREGDERMDAICRQLNDDPTRQCVTAERIFLKSMGGGCQVPVAAYAEIVGDEMRMRAVSYLGKEVRRGESRRPIKEAALLAQELAVELGGHLR